MTLAAGARLPRPTRLWLTLAWTFAAYVAVVQLFSLVSIPPENVSLLWLPNAVVVVALLLTERRSWWAIWATGVLAEIVGDAFQDIDAVHALWFGVVNMVEATAIVLAVERFAGRGVPLRTARSVSVFITASTAVPALTGMAGAVGSVIAFDSEWVDAWRAWWFGDAIGIVVGVPVGFAILSFSAGVVTERSRTFIAEVAAAFVAVSGIAMLLAADDRLASAQQVAIAAGVLAALALGAVGAAAGGVLIAVTAIVPAAREIGTLSVVETQAFILFVAAAVLFVGAAIESEHLSVRALAGSEERFRTTFEDAPIGMAIEDLSAGGGRRWTRVNAALVRTLGYSHRELLAMDPVELVHPDDRDDDGMGRLLAGTTARADSEHRFRHADGHYVWCRVVRSVVRSPVTGRPALLVTQLEDVTAARDAAARLEHAALHDSLTGLPNRLLFMDRLAHRLAELGRSHDLVAVLYVDLDHFKRVNDSRGHDAGDTVLIEVARRLSAAVRPGDTVARIGGDEFAILCGDVSSDEAVVQLAERVTASLTQPLDLDGQMTDTAGSVGVAVTRERWHDPADLLRAADTAMYQAKRRGGGRFEVFDQDLVPLVVDHLEDDADRRDAT